MNYSEPLLPFEIPEQVDAVQPSEVLGLPGFSKNVYAQDLFAIFSAAPASQPEVAEMHNAWFKCRRPGLDELWASRHPTEGGYQKTLPGGILRKICTLEELLRSATAEPLVRKLQVLLLDHLMLMRVTYTSWELPSHYFPDFDARFGGLIEALGTAEPSAATAGTSSTSSATANILPEVRTRIANLRVGPETVTPLDRISGNVEGKKRIKHNILLSTEVPHLITKGFEPQNILLHGAPGTGKTLLAMASAAENKDCTVYSVLSSDLIERWQGASEQNIVALFAIAAETAPAVIVIDEIEGLCLSRSSSSASETSTHRIANAFLASMTKYSRVLVIGTTNLPWQLDHAFGRRFRNKIHVGLPSEATRLEILRSRLQQLNHTVSETEMVSVARDCRGYTGDAVSEIVSAARAELIGEIGTATYFRPVSIPE